MSFLTQTVAIPVWVIILVGVVLLPLIFPALKKILRQVQQQNNADAVKERNKSGSPGEKAQIENVLQILSAEGDKGMLLRSVSDRLGIASSAAQKAMAKLVQSKMVDEVVGVSGTRYYLTRLGKQYCASKNF